MEPPRWDGPSIDYGVESRLARLDRQLVVTFSPFALDPLSGRVIETNTKIDPETGNMIIGAVRDPAYYLWRRDENSTHHFFVQAYPLRAGGFGYRQVLALERDLARFIAPQHLAAYLADRDREIRERMQAQHDQLQADKISANRSKIERTLSGMHAGDGSENLDRRQANITSYPGQKNRGTPGEIEMDSKEAGWELPDEG